MNTLFLWPLINLIWSAILLVASARLLILSRQWERKFQQRNQWIENQQRKRRQL